MEHIAPLIQTILWVGLIGGIVYRFNKPIYGVLVALQKRIESGSNVKAGPFEISDLKPQEADAQKQKALAEIKEALEVEEAIPSAVMAPPATDSLVKFKTSIPRYFQAEDLALRAIQTEFGTPINRQVTAGRDGGFDGVFTSQGHTNVVEVKYVPGKNMSPKIRPSIQHLTKIIEQYRWENAQIILVVVFENDEDIKKPMEILSSAFSENRVPVVVRIFTMGHLLKRFGAEAGGNEG